MFDFFKKKKKGDEKAFWDWFVKNHKKLETFMQNGANDYAIYNKLSEAIKDYNELLFAELTGGKNGGYVLIITPDGIKDGIEPTRKLYDARLEIPNWEVVKFRQPWDDAKIELEGVSYDSAEIRVLAEIDQEREVADLRIYIPGMSNDEQKYQHLAFLYLDHVLGEFNVLTRVGYIDFEHLDEGSVVGGSISLLELRKLIEDNLY